MNNNIYKDINSIYDKINKAKVVLLRMKLDSEKIENKIFKQGFNKEKERQCLYNYLQLKYGIDKERKNLELNQKKMDVIEKKIYEYSYY